MMSDATQTTRRLRVLAILAVLVQTILALTTVVLGVVTDLGAAETLGDPWILPVIALPTAAALLVLVRPDLRYSWLLLGAGVGVLSSLVIMAAAEADVANPALVQAIGYAINTAAIALSVPLIMLLFPDGTLLSRRWRPVVALVGVTSILGASAALVNGGWGGDPLSGDLVSPLAERLESVGTILTRVFFPLMLTSFLLAALSLILRFRRSDGVQRRQLLWLAVAGGYMIAMGLVVLVTGGTVGLEGVQAWMMASAFALLPVGITVAVLRYRLYDVDIIVNRSLVVGGLAVFILAVYVGVVVGVGTLVSATGDPGIGVRIGATALVAVGFHPARQRLRRWADRVVYGHRASPYEVLGAFASIAGRAPDQATLQRLADLLAQGTGARPAVVWLRVGDRLRPVAASDTTDVLDVAVHDGSGVDAVPGDLLVLVEHGDELLGALAITKARGESVTDQDKDVTRRLADAIAWTLRTERLTAELADRVQELRASRVRIVRAQDTARQQLERDLHDGAQQELVALKVKLGLARTLASRVEAPRTQAMLEDLGTDADEAVDSLRTLARGIYPPLLESDGLVAALTAHARRSPVDVDISGEAPRAPRDTEIAVYTCVLEAIQNAASHGRAERVTVMLDHDGDHIRFEVHDDGVGFDPATTPAGPGLQAMQDRLDIVGGTMRVESRPGAGTTISAQVPQPSDISVGVR
jgi:signal transduction histidine kinase